MAKPGYGLELVLTGRLDASIQATNWLATQIPRQIIKAFRSEAEFLAKEMKKNLKKGGRPPFSPIKPFTRVVRRAMGARSIRPGISAGHLLQNIKDYRIGASGFFAGVKRGAAMHPIKNMDMADVAMLLEEGRKEFLMELDRPSPKTKKTPRQWLWWLYFQGALSYRPSMKKTHMRIRESPKRPFVSQVFEAQGEKIPVRLSKRIETELRKVPFTKAQIKKFKL